jgi:hypothetical protein
MNFCVGQKFRYFRPFSVIADDYRGNSGLPRRFWVSFLGLGLWFVVCGTGAVLLQFVPVGRFPLTFFGVGSWVALVCSFRFRFWGTVWKPSSVDGGAGEGSGSGSWDTASMTESQSDVVSSSLGVGWCFAATSSHQPSPSLLTAC